MKLSLPQLINQYKTATAEIVNFRTYNQQIHTYHSTAIEGNKLTWEEMQAFLVTGSFVTNKPVDHHLMIVDHQIAWQLVLDLAVNREPLNRTMLQSVAAAVMRQTGGPTNAILGSFDSSKGDFRTVSAMAGSRMFMDAKKVPSAIDTLLKEINTALPAAKTIRQVYDLSFQAHYQFVTIHPFGDGNGRTSRLLMNYVQQYHNLPLSLVFVDDRAAYINALELSRKQQTMQPIFDFMYSQLAIFLTNESDQLKK